eukprot:18165-Eustigmatos_ZCMA.PRE.1
MAQAGRASVMRQRQAAVKPASPAAEPPVAFERSGPDADDSTAVAPSSPFVAVEGAATTRQGSSEGKRSVQSPTRKPT